MVQDRDRRGPISALCRAADVVRTFDVMTTLDHPTTTNPAAQLLLDEVASIAAELCATAPAFDRTGELDTAAFSKPLRAAGIAAALVPAMASGMVLGPLTSGVLAEVTPGSTTSPYVLDIVLATVLALR